MRWVWTVVVWSGCESEVCGLLGEYSGSFEGDAEGVVQLAVTEDDANPPDQATAGMTLLSDDGSVSADGVGTLTCSSGELVVDLRDIDATSIGEAAGTVAEDGTGGGEWSLVTGDAGTWSLN